MKDKDLDREVYITVLPYVTVQRCYLMYRYDSIEAIVFAMYVIGSTRRPTMINKFAVIVSQHITTPLCISLVMVALVVPYFFNVRIITMMTA